MVSPLMKQVWVVSGVLLNMLGQGMVLSYPSALLPALKDKHSSIQTDMETASWLASAVGISYFIGFITSSFLMDWCGRKVTHCLVVLPGAMGWLLIYLATNVPTLMVGRVLGGITGGATVTLGAVVIGEYSSPTYRGMFLNLKTASLCIGNTAIHILTHFYSWRTIALYALLPQMVAFAIICTWVESPAWLASKKLYDKSEVSFFWLRGIDDQSIAEFNKMIKTQKTQSNINKRTCGERVGQFFKKFTMKNFIKPVLIMFFAIVTLEASGRHVFPAYAMDILGEITGSKMQSFYYILCIDLITIASALFSSILVWMVNRRTLLFTSGITSLVMLGSICTYLFLSSKDIIPKVPWIPISMFIIYFVLANLGCTPIPLALLGEILPLTHRGAGTAVVGFVMSLLLLLVLKVSPMMLETLKVHGTFAVYGIILGMALVFLHFLLPETKDRTLQEIEEHFNYGKFKNDTKDNEANMKMMENA